MISIIECRGDAFAMGAAQGVGLKSRLKQTLAKLSASPLLDGAPRIVRNASCLRLGFFLLGLVIRIFYCRAFRPAPTIAARMRGMAAAGKVSYTTLCGLSAYEVLASYHRFKIGPGSCTSIALAAVHSASGKPLLARNFDYPPYLAGEFVLRRSAPQEGYASLEITHPIMIGAHTGVNEQGLCVSLNEAYCREPLRQGLPLSFLVQLILENCQNVPEAVTFIRSHSRASTGMLTLLDAQDRSCILELTRGRMDAQLRHHGSETLYVTNHLLCPYTREVQIAEDVRSRISGDPFFVPSQTRRERAGQLLQKHPHDLASLTALLADHHNQDRGLEFSICSHGAFSSTLLAAIVDPVQREMHVAAGPPCKNQFKWVGLRSNQ